MKTIILLFTLVLVSCGSSHEESVLTRNVTRAMEYAYFEGQKDALGGDIRIDSLPLSDGSYRYVWIKSPWTHGPAPIYVPGDSLNQVIYK